MPPDTADLARSGTSRPAGCSRSHEPDRSGCDPSYTGRGLAVRRQSLGSRLSWLSVRQPPHPARHDQQRTPPTPRVLRLLHCGGQTGLPPLGGQTRFVLRARRWAFRWALCCAFTAAEIERTASGVPTTSTGSDAPARTAASIVGYSSPVRESISPLLQISLSLHAQSPRTQHGRPRSSRPMLERGQAHRPPPRFGSLEGQT